MQRFPSLAPLFRWKHPRGAVKLRPSNFAPHRTGRNFDPRTITDALVFARIIPRHHAKFPVLLCKPYRLVNRSAILPESCQGDVFLTLNFPRDRHERILAVHCPSTLRLAAIARKRPGVLQA